MFCVVALETGSSVNPVFLLTGLQAGQSPYMTTAYNIEREATDTLDLRGFSLHRMDSNSLPL